MDPVYPPPRQTLGYLRNLLTERGIQPKNKLGQNFLIDLNLIDLILRTAELTKDDVALEIGSGTGSLTARLAADAGGVVSVELDPPFARMVRELVGERDNVTLLHADVLHGKNTLNPAVLDAIRERMAASNARQLKLVANLPYAVAVPVLSNLLLTELPIERMVGTVQWEIAERLTASPGTKDYGALSILVQSVAEVSIVRRLAPSVFWPKPKVDSAIVLVRPSAEKRARVGDVPWFRNFLRDLYTHRRKNLRGALIGLPSGSFTKAEVDAKLEELGIDGGVRAEVLTLDEHLELCEAFGGPASATGTA